MVGCSAEFDPRPDRLTQYLPFLALITGVEQIRVNMVVNELEVKLVNAKCKRGLALEDVAAHQKKLWENKAFSDAIVTCAGTRFPVHRAILAVASPVFERGFSGDMQEGQTAYFNIRDSTPMAVDCAIDSTVAWVFLPWTG